MPPDGLQGHLLHLRPQVPHALQLLLRCARRPARQPPRLREQLRTHLQVPLVRLPPQYPPPHAESLLLQFYRLANIYFLVIGILQSIPEISPLGPLTAWAPLIVVLGISMIREGKPLLTQDTRTTSDTNPTRKSTSSLTPKSTAMASSCRSSGARSSSGRW